MAKTKQEKLDIKAEKAYYKKNKQKFRLKPSDITFNIINYAFFGIFTLSCIFPFYYLFINTISDNSLVSKGLINFLPEGIHIQNYLMLLNVPDLGNSFIVSLARTLIGTALMVVSSAFVGYLVTKNEMWQKKFWYRFLIITMYFNAGLIPWYLNMAMLGLTNTFAAYIIPGIVAPYNIILVKTYIESIPAELEESAFMDGAGYVTIFRKIIWPLSKPILATIAIFGAVGHWNSFTDSLILMQNAPELHTLQHRLYTYLNTSSNLSALMSGSGAGIENAVSSSLNSKVIKYTISMVSIIPILLVYPFMQRYFEKGIMLGAVKG
jgi:putative aldouronate transport system permease protein